MARSLSFSNGELYIGLDDQGLVKDIYFPYIGSELHTAECTHRIGVWVDGYVSWVNSDEWIHKSRYAYNALVGHTVLTNEKIGIVVEFEDFVDATNNIFVRNIHIVNLRSEQREVRLFAHQAFQIGNDNTADTAQYMPNLGAVLHYGGRRAFIASGMTDMGELADQRSIGLFGEGREGTWRDGEDGDLVNGDVANGQVDSTLRFSLTIGGLSSRRVHYWLTAATSIRVAKTLDSDMRNNGILNRLEVTTKHWRKWLSPSLKIAERLDSKHRQPFIQSLLQIKSSSDWRGGIVSVPGDQTEAYVVPRIGAYTAWPLIRLGYKEDALSFFGFCKSGLADEGYLLSGYGADGSNMGSSHPYDGDLPPIQSDQTALVAFVFSQVYSLNKQGRILKDYYSSLLLPMTNFLCDFTDEKGLPRPSYDLSHKNKTVSTYTIAVTYAALIAAADLAEVAKDQDHAVKWRTAAEEMHRSAVSLVRSEDGRLHESVGSNKSDISSFFGAFMFGLFDVDSEVIRKTAEHIESSLRFEHGLFAMSEQSLDIDYVGSLWMSQYYMEVGRTDDAMQILSQVMNDINSGSLGTKTPIWVYAELVSALLDTMTRE